METRLRAGLQCEHGERLSAVLFVHHVQLKLHNWFEAQMEFGSPEAMASPRFESGLEIFSEGGATYWMPMGEDVELIKPLASARSRPSPTLAPAPVVSGGRGNRTGGREALTPGERVANNNRDPRMMEAPLEANVRARSVTDAISRGGAPPTITRAGTPVPSCASWHAKGTCYDNCCRSADHVCHNNQEREQFHTWCQQAFA